MPSFMKTMRLDHERKAMINVEKILKNDVFSDFDLFSLAPLLFKE
jgi:hypothetical protein